VLELAADGRVLTMTPTGSETGARNSRLEMRLLLWADHQGGWKVFGSSTGFCLPDGSVLSPDASLVRLDRWQALTAEERHGFAPLCPDLVVELASLSDEGPRVRAAWLVAHPTPAGGGDLARQRQPPALRELASVGSRCRVSRFAAAA